MEVLQTPIQARQANVICERLLEGVRCECLDRIPIASEAHLRCARDEYMMYSDCSRPHRGIDQRVPERVAQSGSSAGDVSRIIPFPVGVAFIMPIVGWPDRGGEAATPVDREGRQSNSKNGLLSLRMNQVRGIAPHDGEFRSACASIDVDVERSHIG